MRRQAGLVEYNIVNSVIACRHSHQVWAKVQCRTKVFAADNNVQLTDDTADNNVQLTDDTADNNFQLTDDTTDNNVQLTDDTVDYNVQLTDDMADNNFS